MVKKNLTPHQELMLYGSFKPSKQKTKAKGVSTEKVKTRRSAEEILEQKKIDEQFNYL